MSINKKEIGETLSGPNLLNVGDVVAIPLKGNEYGYCRCYQNVSLGVLDLRTRVLLSLDEVKKYPVKFFVEYCEPTDSPSWIYIGRWKFDSKEDSWGPPTYVRDIINPKEVRILERGQMRSATEQEIVGLNMHRLLFPESIRETITEHICCNRPR